MIEVKLPDGTTVRFPDGTPQEVMRGALAKIAPPKTQAPALQSDLNGLSEAFQTAAQGQMGPPMPPDTVLRQQAAKYFANNDQGAAMATAGGVAQGGTFGLSDEIAARLQSLRPDVTYDQALAIERGRLDAARANHPVAAYGGEVAGAVAVPVGTIGTAGSRGVMAAKSAGLGALLGGAYGYGSGEGDGRAANAVRGAIMGGGIGFGAPIALAGAGAVGNALKNPVSNALNLVNPRAVGGSIEAALKRAGMSADEVQKAVNAAASDGQPMYTIADALGPAGQRMLSGMTRQPGSARQVVTDALMARQSGQGGRLSSFVADALGAPDTAAKRVATLTAARKSAADAAYSAAGAGASPVDVRSALGVIDDRIGGMKGSGIAGDGIDAKLAAYRARLAAPKSALPKGVTARELSNFDRVLGIKQQVSDDIGAATRAGRNNEARELGKLQDALDAALEEASAAYRSANDEFARASRVIDKVDEGAAATSGRVRSENTAAAYAKMTPEERAAFRVGYADPTIARIDSAAPGVNKARPLMSDKATAELGMMDANGRVVRQIRRENTMFETTNAALGGSRTADNIADSADAAGLSSSVLMNILTGRWGAAATQAGDKALSSLMGRSEATREQIVRALLSSDVAAAMSPAVKARLASAKNNSALSALLLKALAPQMPEAGRYVLP